MQGIRIELMLGPHLGHTGYKSVGTSSYTNLAKFGDDRETRTLTLLRARDFKSLVAAITPYRQTLCASVKNLFHLFL